MTTTCPPNERRIIFTASEEGTLTMQGCSELKLRRDFYENVVTYWDESPQKLSETMDDCQPLAWEVQSIYCDYRDEVTSVIDAERVTSLPNLERIDALEEQLKQLPEEPEEGVVNWLLTMPTKEFENRIIPRVQRWLEEPPDWDFEYDRFMEAATPQGAALEFFRDMDIADLDALGVKIVDGEHPGSTYYAAELWRDVSEANRAAEDRGIPVVFKELPV